MTTSTHTSPTNTLPSTDRRPPSERVARQPRARREASAHPPRHALSPLSCASRSTPGPGSGCWPASGWPRCSPPAPSSPGRPRSSSPTARSRSPSAIPMSVILPIIAALSVTAEWSQRSGLTTFTLAPHRGRVLLAKAAAAVLLAVAVRRRCLRRRRAGQPDRRRGGRHPHRVGPGPRRLRLLHAGQHPAPARRLHPRRPDPQQRRSHRRLHALCLRCAWTAGLPRAQPGVVRATPVPGSTPSTTRTHSSTVASRQSNGLNSVSPASSGWPCPCWLPPSPCSARR